MKKPSVYYGSYSQACTAVWDYVSEKFVLDPEDWFHEINLGGKPKVGQTKRASIGLYNLQTKKPLKKALHIQVFRMSAERFELNFYIN
jgi:hypothetical protein